MISNNGLEAGGAYRGHYMTIHVYHTATLNDVAVACGFKNQCELIAAHDADEDMSVVDNYISKFNADTDTSAAQMLEHRQKIHLGCRI